MSKIFSLTVFLSLAAICFTASAADYKQITPGVSYAHIIDKSVPWSIHVTKFDYTRPDLHLLAKHAHDTIFGLATVKDQLAVFPKTLGHPIAAVNGDFFLIEKVPYQGDPKGLQILDGELSSGPGKELAFWLDAANKPHFKRVNADFKVTVAGSTFKVALNETRTATNATLLTPALGTSTRTSNGVELVLVPDNNEASLPLHAGEKCTAHVAEIHNSGNTPLHPGIMVLSLGPKFAQTLPTISTGAEVKLSLSLSPALKGVRTAIGGGPALVHNGKKLEKEERRTDHMHIRNPRTAIGWNDHDFFMVVVDGRQKQLSVGMTFAELGQLMINLGCKEAINLDGGGSSTMWLDGKIANSPSEKGVLRRVANTLILVQSPERGLQSASASPSP